MEFVVITYPIPRNVFMDGMPQGITGQILRVQRGHHSFDLGLPHDYEPMVREENVVGTTKPEPMVVSFEPATAVAAGAPPSRRGRAASAEPLAAPARKRATARARGRKRAAKTSRRRPPQSPRRSRKK